MTDNLERRTGHSLCREIERTYAVDCSYDGLLYRVNLRISDGGTPETAVYVHNADTAWTVAACMRYMHNRRKHGLHQNGDVMTSD